MNTFKVSYWPVTVSQTRNQGIKASKGKGTNVIVKHKRDKNL